MIYLQMKSRVILEPGEQLKIRHVADVRGESHVQTKELLDTLLVCPSSPGIWKIPVIHVMDSLRDFVEQITPVGPPECYVHFIPRNKQNKVHLFRSVLAFILLMIGSMLAISWFHADVNMMDAQKNLYHIITGKEVKNTLLLSFPYAVGVFFGVSLFYALLGKKGAVSPLDIKLSEYHTTSEKATGKTP